VEHSRSQALLSYPPYTCVQRSLFTGVQVHHHLIQFTATNYDAICKKTKNKQTNNNLQYHQLVWLVILTLKQCILPSMVQECTSLTCHTPRSAEGSGARKYNFTSSRIWGNNTMLMAHTSRCTVCAGTCLSEGCGNQQHWSLGTRLAYQNHSSRSDDSST
jgi:hypothetical protein